MGLGVLCLSKAELFELTLSELNAKTEAHRQKLKAEAEFTQGVAAWKTAYILNRLRTKASDKMVTPQMLLGQKPRQMSKKDIEEKRAFLRSTFRIK